MRPQTRSYVIAYVLGFLVVMVATAGVYLAQEGLSFSSDAPTAAVTADVPAQETFQNDTFDRPLDLNRAIGN